MPVLETSRVELHKLVWSKPVRDVAEQLGMSDTGVAKLCKRNNVPRPPGGYWLRSIKRKAPPTLTGADKPIRVYLHDKIPKTEKVEIEIPVVTVTALHKLVVQCRVDMRGAKADEYGRLTTERTDMHVSKKSLSRGLALMNQIVRTALKMGYSVDKNSRRIELMRDGESISIGFYEQSTRSIKKVKHYNTYRREYYTTKQRVYTPSGILRFELFGAYSGQREWSDRPNKPLESRVVEIMRGIYNTTEHQKARRIENVKEQYRKKITYQKTQRLARIAALTVEREQRANQLIDGWQRSQEIAVFLESLQGEELTPQLARLIRWVSDDLVRHHNPIDPYRITALEIT